jgi:GT2 family glycosyltransferase
MTQAPDFEPVRMLEVEIGQPLPHLHALDDRTGRDYRRANCLIRLHRQPLGIVELQFDESGVSPQECARRIWQTLRAQIIEHLQQDGLPVVTELDAAGLPCSSATQCIEERERFFTNAPFVSIIIPTHDRPERIPACLRSLLALHYPHFEIIIVDNAPSTNATADFIQQTYRDVPQVRYVREDHPGLSWAHNCGRKAARGKILAFTDDDVVVDPYWLIELVRGFSVADNVGCVTGLVLPLELETPAQLWFEEFGGFNKGFTRGVYDMGKNHPKTPLYPYTAGRFGTGANMAFTAAFLDSAGGFDPALGTGTPAQNGEDLAAFFQVVARGYTLVYTPTALLYHLHRRDYPGLYKQIYTYGVGLTAYLTKSVFDNPRLLFDLVTKLPYGLYFTLNARSPKNSKKTTQYPRELTRVELQGMLYGPLAYLRSRRASRDSGKVFSSGEHTTLVVEKENR